MQRFKLTNTIPQPCHSVTIWYKCTLHKIFVLYVYTNYVIWKCDNFRFLSAKPHKRREFSWTAALMKLTEILFYIETNDHHNIVKIKYAKVCRVMSTVWARFYACIYERLIDGCHWGYSNKKLNAFQINIPSGSLCSLNRI